MMEDFKYTFEFLLQFMVIIWISGIAFFSPIILYFFFGWLINKKRKSRHLKTK
jgi:hypothetical protein